MSAARGLRPARAAPHSGYRGSWSCTARSACVEGAESPHLETAPQPAAARPRQARTTRPLPAQAVRSRRAGSPPERGEVSPLVVSVEWDAIVCRVGSVDLDRAIAGQESG